MRSSLDGEALKGNPDFSFINTTALSLHIRIYYDDAGTKRMILNDTMRPDSSQKLSQFGANKPALLAQRFSEEPLYISIRAKNAKDGISGIFRSSFVSFKDMYIATTLETYGREDSHQINERHQLVTIPLEKDQTGIRFENETDFEVDVRMYYVDPKSGLKITFMTDKVTPWSVFDLAESKIFRADLFNKCKHDSLPVMVSFRSEAFKDGVYRTRVVGLNALQSLKLKVFEKSKSKNLEPVCWPTYGTGYEFGL